MFNYKKEIRKWQKYPATPETEEKKQKEVVNTLSVYRTILFAPEH